MDIVTVGSVLGLVSFEIWILIAIFRIFGRGRKTVYWDKKAGQIVTGRGECLYDKRQTQNIYTLYTSLEKSFARIEKKLGDMEKEGGDGYARLEACERQIKCAATEHEMVFKEPLARHPFSDFTPLGAREIKRFRFHCTRCGFVVTKSELSLTSKEKQALIGLGLLDKEVKKRKK